ncbi:MAG: hypothetical protein ACOVNL_06995 [Prochlorococcaceae cyanobacterium]|jgi:hypothetical protein
MPHPAQPWLAATLPLLAACPALALPPPAPSRGILRSLQNGDRACYAEVEDSQGVRRSLEAAFELCERTDLIGRRVQLVRRTARVLAASCQGDPDCGRSDEVQLIVELRPLP